MHELSIASSLAEAVLSFADAHGIDRVLQVNLWIGELTHIESEQLRFCFGAITTETALAEAFLEIETMAATVRCAHCSYEGTPTYWDGALSGKRVPTLQCPACGQATEPIAGHECSIRSIRFIGRSEQTCTGVPA